MFRVTNMMYIHYRDGMGGTVGVRGIRRDGERDENRNKGRRDNERE